MQTTVLTEVYELLRSIGAVANEAEFSRDWLGRSEGYVRGLRFKGLGASTGSLAICASKLQHYGLQMCESAVTGSLASSSKS
jgi:hypothetical protein